MPTRTSKTGSERFIVDNSDTDWKVLRYLRDWCPISRAIDIATGYFEIGSLLALGDGWKSVEKIRIHLGDEVSLRTKAAFAVGLTATASRLDRSLEIEKQKNDFLAGIPRRERRNGFFHSTHLLDLNLHPRDCVEAFCDLLEYGALLFPADWSGAVAGNMETCEALIRLDRKSYNDPSLGPKVNDVFAKCRRSGIKPKKLGCEVAHHAEDMHLRLAIRNGGAALRDKLRALI